MSSRARLHQTVACKRGGHERGFALITILLMVVVLGALALGAMNSSILQEQMAGNVRDKNIALQSAEAALRDAEADIVALTATATSFSSACTAGLCTPPSMTASDPSSKPLWQSLTWDAAHTRRYGQYTGATALPDVATQPAYVIELLPGIPPGVGASVNLGSQGAQQPQVFRITAQATGRHASTSVMLQSVYIRQ